LIEIIGEAATRIPAEIQENYPQVPWMQMIAARNRLIHGYDSVDFDILWNIIDRDLPELVDEIRKILSEANRY